MTLKFNRVLEVVEIHLHANFHQTKCSGSWIINSALDFGQLWLWSWISGTDQAINKRIMALWTTEYDFSTWWNNWTSVHWQKMTMTLPMTLKFNRVHAVVKLMFLQNCIKLSAAVHELSCPQVFFALSCNHENPIIRSCDLDLDILRVSSGCRGTCSCKT